MRNRWQLSLLTLVGLAAAISIAALAHSPSPVGAHAGPGVDRWAIDNPHQPDTKIEWNGHAHDTSEWEITFSDPETDWEGQPVWNGDPNDNPCVDTPDGLDRAHCAYVIKHYNPWLINKDRHDHWNTPEHPFHGDVISSWCAVIARGAPGNRTVFEPANTILFVDDTGQATCIDGDDHHSGGPGAEAGTQPTHRYHGDDDFIDQHGSTINAGITREVAQVAANSHTLRGPLGGAPGTPGHRPDEVVAQGRHRNDGSINYTTQNSLNLTGRHDHKTVMFWVWWERAADTEPLCDDGTQPPCPEPQEATRFVPEVAISVDGSPVGHSGAVFEVWFAPVGGSGSGCSATRSQTLTGRVDGDAQTFTWSASGHCFVSLPHQPTHTTGDTVASRTTTQIRSTRRHQRAHTTGGALSQMLSRARLTSVVASSPLSPVSPALVSIHSLVNGSANAYSSLLSLVRNPASTIR